MNKAIVHVLDAFPSKSETFIINHIIECEKKGYNSVILANKVYPLSESSQEELIKSFGLQKVAKSYNPKLPNNKFLRVLKALMVLLKHLNNYKVFIKTLNSDRYGLKAKTLKMWFQAAVFIQYKNIKMFHAHFGVNGKLLAEMKEIGAIKGDIITSFYGYDTFSTESNREELKTYYKGVFKASKQIITSSHYLFSNLKMLEVPEEKLRVNPVGVDVTKFTFKEHPFKKRLNIITVGRLIELKGQHLGIEAVSLLLKKGHQITYTIVGYGEEDENLRAQISKSGFQENIKIEAGGSQKRVRDLLYNNHVFLMTSITDSFGRAEGQGLVIAEAQSAGLPVVAFDSGGISDSIQDHKTGYLVEEKNSQQMADKLENFIHNPDLIYKMGKAGRQFVEVHFNSEKQSEKLIEFYN